MFRKGDFDTPEPDPDLVSLPYFNDALSERLVFCRMKIRKFGGRILEMS